MSPQQDWAREALEGAVEARLDNGDRALMLVVGSGLHKHLPHGPPPAASGPPDNLLADWRALLRAAYDSEAHGGRPWAALHHEDDTATWESMVVEWSHPRHKGSIKEAVRALNRSIRDQITGALASADPALAGFGARLHAAKYRDVATLNFDLALDRALTLASGDGGSRHRRAKSHVDYRLRFCIERSGRRIWHPHGVAGHQLRVDSIQLGILDYGDTLAALNNRAFAHRRLRSAWVRAHRDEDAPGYWTPGLHAEWAEHVRADPVTFPTWLDRFLISDVAFVGCSLSRAEIDLWFALHVRQRELLGVPDAERPRAYFLGKAGTIAPHIRNGPAGLFPVETPDHDGVWRLLELV